MGRDQKPCASRSGEDGLVELAAQVAQVLEAGEAFVTNVSPMAASAVSCSGSRGKSRRDRNLDEFRCHVDPHCAVNSVAFTSGDSLLSRRAVARGALTFHDRRPVTSLFSIPFVGPEPFFITQQKVSLLPHFWQTWTPMSLADLPRPSALMLVSQLGHRCSALSSLR